MAHPKLDYQSEKCPAQSHRRGAPAYTQTPIFFTNRTDRYNQVTQPFREESNVEKRLRTSTKSRSEVSSGQFKKRTSYSQRIRLDEAFNKVYNEKKILETGIKPPSSSTARTLNQDSTSDNHSHFSDNESSDNLRDGSPSPAPRRAMLKKKNQRNTLDFSVGRESNNGWACNKYLIKSRSRCDENNLVKSTCPNHGEMPATTWGLKAGTRPHVSDFLRSGNPDDTEDLSASISKECNLSVVPNNPVLSSQSDAKLMRSSRTALTQSNDDRKLGIQRDSHPENDHIGDNTTCSSMITSPLFNVGNTKQKIENIRDREIQSLNRLEKTSYKNAEGESFIGILDENHKETPLYAKPSFQAEEIKIILRSEKSVPSESDITASSNAKIYAAVGIDDSSPKEGLSGSISEKRKASNNDAEPEKGGQKSKENITAASTNTSPNFIGNYQSFPPSEDLGLNFGNDKMLDADPQRKITTDANMLHPQPPEREPGDSVHLLPHSLAPFQEEGKSDDTPKPKPLALPTPKIMGAYIETPVAAASSNRNLHTRTPRRVVSQGGQDIERETKVSSRLTQVETKYTSRSAPSPQEVEEPLARPCLINTSQRVTVSEDLRRFKMEKSIEDSDFEMFLEDMEKTAPEPVLSIEYQKQNRIILPGEDDLTSSIEKMHRSLRSTSHNIYNAKQGLQRLGKHAPNPSTLPAILGENKFQHSSKIKGTIPKFYVTSTPPRPEEPAGFFRNRKWKFTWLGVIVCAFGLWAVTEIVMCEAFCHPKYSSKNTWHPSDPFFPWAIPTKLDQWTGQVATGTIAQVLDWINPKRHQKWRRPKHLYSGHDWWEGKPGPVLTYPPIDAREEVSSIDDDETWI